MDNFLKAIAIQPTSPPAGIVVCLHGWGANAEDLAAMAPLINLSNYLLLFPDAPFAHPQISGGKMWYDFQNPDSTQLATSRQMLKDYLNGLPETTSVPTERTFLLGFSQGAAMALDIGLDFNLAGIIGLSGYLHPLTQPDFQPPILIVHGTQDMVVPLIAAQSAKTTLTKLGSKVSYHEFEMGHEINAQAIAKIRQFILVTND